MARFNRNSVAEDVKAWLPGGRDLPGVHHALLDDLPLDLLIVPHQRVLHGPSYHPDVLEQMLIGLEQRVYLAAVVPPRHRRGEQPAAAVYHVLERVREIVLATLPGRLRQRVRDAVEQRLPVPDVLQPDVREP